MKQRRLTVGIAPDSYKGTASAMQVADLIEKGLRRAIPDVVARKIPMADGGEGTVDAMVGATGGRRVRRTVRDPLGRPVKAVFGFSGDGRTAIIEMASASGLPLLTAKERNPLKATTAGTGDLMRAALDLGVERILIGIGGSATSDGGTGMARALGVRFLDARGRELPAGGGSLGKLDRIDVAELDRRVDDVAVEVACDVDNPLTGPRGATAVYGPQKGATPAMVTTLDANLKHLARIVKRDLGISILRVPGAGAAGGLGGGLMAFAGGVLRPGVDIVIDCVDLKARLTGCDVVITGEGRMDGQTVFGKTPAGVARVAKELGLPVIAICGCLGKGVSAVHEIGIDAYFATLTHSIPAADIPKLGRGMLMKTAEEVGRLLALR